MDTLMQTYRIKLDLTPTDYVRSFHDDVNWKNRLIGILGQRGVGKSTMLLQHIKLYDNVEFEPELYQTPEVEVQMARFVKSLTKEQARRRNK